MTKYETEIGITQILPRQYDPEKPDRIDQYSPAMAISQVFLNI